MPLSFCPVNQDFVAEVEGIDIARPLEAEEVAAIEAGMDRFAILVFRRDRPLEREEQLRFTQYFGTVEPPYAVPQTGDGQRRLAPGLGDISNLARDGSLLPREDRRRLYNLGNQLWHSDSSFKPVPAKYSLLCAHAVPPADVGGNTEFADMRAAWDGLDSMTQALVRDLVCEHSLIYSRGTLGFSAFTEEERALYHPVPQRLVRRHPGSGRLSLFLSAHIGAVRGWPLPEALALIRELTEHATQRTYVHAHIWRPGDLVVWDNRTTMHRARRFDDQVHARDLRRTTLRDIAPTLEQAA